MRRFFKASRTYIFVAPLMMAGGDGGCSGSKPGPLTEEAFEKQAVGYTFQREGDEVYGYIEKDGVIRAKIEGESKVKNDTGTWKFKGEKLLCVEWEVQLHTKNNCAEFTLLEDGKYGWGGHTFVRLEGNPKKI